MMMVRKPRPVIARRLILSRKILKVFLNLREVLLRRRQIARFQIGGQLAKCLRNGIAALAG